MARTSVHDETGQLFHDLNREDPINLFIKIPALFFFRDDRRDVMLHDEKGNRK